MRQILQKYADNIDAMALRERALFFGAVALVLMTLLQVFLLNPVLSRRNQLSAQIAQQDDEAKAIQAQIQTLVRSSVQDQDAVNREKINGLRAQIAQLDGQFHEQQKQFVPPDKMVAVLQNVIVKNKKLELISLRNLPATSQSPGVGAAAEGAAKGKGAGSHEIYRHTVELSVKGGYFDLLDYLAALEGMPQRVFWDGFELDASGYPQSVLKLRLYTLSPDKSWLSV